MQRHPRQYCVRECAQLCLTTRIKLTPAAAKLNPAASEVVAPSITNPVDPSRSVIPMTAGKVAAPNTIRISPAAEDPPHAPTIMSSNPSPLISCDLISEKVRFTAGFSWRAKRSFLKDGWRLQGKVVFPVVLLSPAKGFPWIRVESANKDETRMWCGGCPRNGGRGGTVRVF